MIEAAKRREASTVEQKAQPKPKLKLKPNSELKPAVEEAVPTQVDILKVTASSIEA